MNTYEITLKCRDDDWIYWHQMATDFHDACQAGFDRVNMASIDPNNKLHGARLIRVVEVRAYNGDYSGSK